MDYVLTHHGIKGQKWGVRRFQNEDGTRTAAGKKRNGDQVARDHEHIRKADRALRKAHLMPKNEHGQHDRLKNTFDKEAKQISKDNLAYAKTKLSAIDKSMPEYKQAKNAVEQAKRDYKAVKRGNKLRVGVSRPGLFPNMRADAIQNTYDNYKRRGYSDKDAAYAAFGNIAVKKYFLDTTDGL